MLGYQGVQVVGVAHRLSHVLGHYDLLQAHMALHLLDYRTATAASQMMTDGRLSRFN